MVPQYIKDKFRGAVPQYLIDAFAYRARVKREREAEAARIKAENLAALERRNALRQPPRNVRMVGGGLEWDAPETACERAPGYYIIEEQRPDGTWMVLATHTRHLRDRTHYRAPLIYGICARVESSYGDSGLDGPRFYSPKVRPAGPDSKYPPDPEPDLPRVRTREERILDALKTYNGPWTFARKVPILSDLRKHSGVADITRKERNAAWKAYKRHGSI